MKSIQLHDSIKGLSQKIVSITLHYILVFKTLKKNNFPLTVDARRTVEGIQAGRQSADARLDLLLRGEVTGESALLVRDRGVQNIHLVVVAVERLV